MITLRLDSKLEQDIKNTANILGVTKSELIRKSVENYLIKLSKPSPWELGQKYFGKYSSKESDSSVNMKQILKAKIKAK